MIQIQKSATADTRTCDFANTSKEVLLASSRQHIGDVVKALAFFSAKLTEAAGEHDYDKLTKIDHFHSDFVTGFKETGWWDNHRRIHRHHLGQADGIPTDVNLLDMLEYIADCVMAGMARAGSVYDLTLPPGVLDQAFRNTVELLKGQVVVSERGIQRQPTMSAPIQDNGSTAVRCDDWLCGAEVSNEEYERRDVKVRPYEVWHEEGDGRPPTFATWREALAKQVEWNKECPGHKARRRRAPHSAKLSHRPEETL